MAIEGPLKELGIHDVFQLLDLNRKTGVLRVTSDLRHNQGSVWVKDGVVAYAEIRSNPHPLGDLLVRSGKITQQQLEHARMSQDVGDTRRIGNILVELGALDAQDLERQVRFQVEEVIFEMMSWREGYFSFVEEDVEEVPGDAVASIRIESLLMEGARRIDEWSRMERKIPHVGVVPVLAPAADGAGGALDLLPSEWEVLASVDGVSDIRVIARTLAKSEFDVAKTIFGLESAGALTILSGPPAPAHGAQAVVDLDSVVDQAEGALAAGEPAAARGLVEAALVTNPRDSRLYVLLGRIHLAVGRDGEAEDCLRRALHIDALYAPAHRLLGDTLARQGRYGEACAWWDRWLKVQGEIGESDSIDSVRAVADAARTLESYLRAAQ